MEEFKKWFFEKLLQWLIDNLTAERLGEWAQAFKDMICPWLRKAKDELIAQLRQAAADTETQIDDAAVNALDKFLDALLPDCEEKL